MKSGTLFRTSKDHNDKRQVSIRYKRQVTGSHANQRRQAIVGTGFRAGPADIAMRDIFDENQTLSNFVN